MQKNVFSTKKTDPVSQRWSVTINLKSNTMKKSLCKSNTFTSQEKILLQLL